MPARAPKQNQKHAIKDYCAKERWGGTRSERAKNQEQKIYAQKMR